MKNPESNDQERKDAAYPYYDLEACIKFASHLKEIGGSKGGVKKSLLAKQVGLAESTPSFFQRLSASKVFGIIEGWGSYALTETGRKYFYPQSEKDKNEAILKLFLTPPAFAFIVKRFDGDKLPNTEIMGNIFHQELGVPDSWKDRVAQIFTRSAYFAGIIDTGGFLRYDAAVHTKPPERPEETLAIASQPIGVVQEVPNPEATRYRRVAGQLNVAPKIWTFSDENRTLLVETPKDITVQEWEVLNQYIQFISPKEKTK